MSSVPPPVQNKPSMHVTAILQGIYEVSVGGSGLSWAQTNASEADFYASLNVYVSGDALLWAWRGLYKAVQESNAFIANMNASPLSTEIKQNYTGQAAFVRGLAYYYLSMMWGGVPLTLEPASSDAVATSKADFSTVASAIIVDWTYAYNNIPDAQQHEDGYIDIDLDKVVDYVIKQAKKDEIGTFEHDEILFVVQAELDFNESGEE